MLNPKSWMLKVAVVTGLVAAWRFEVMTLKQQLAEQESKLHLRAGELSMATSTNATLNQTVVRLAQSIDDERQALSEMQKINATVVANVNKAARDIKERLNENRDKCGDMPLPAPVIDRMRDYYQSADGQDDQGDS